MAAITTSCHVMPQPATQGTRADLAAYLRANRRKLKLWLFDRWDDEGTPTHIFYSGLQRPFFNGSHFLDFQIFPF